MVYYVISPLCPFVHGGTPPVPLDVQNIYLKIFLAWHVFFVHVFFVHVFSYMYKNGTLWCFPCYEMKYYDTDHKTVIIKKMNFWEITYYWHLNNSFYYVSISTNQQLVSCGEIKIWMEHTRRLSVIRARDSRQGIGAKMLYHESL